MKNTFTDLLIRKQTPFARNNITALIMRISQVYFLILTSALVAMAGPKSNGQSIETTTIELEIVNEPLKESLLEIEKQTQFRFQWDVAIEKGFPRVSLPDGKYTVKEALDKLLGKHFGYRQNKNHLIIIPFEEGEQHSQKNAEKGVDLNTKNSAALITGTVTDAVTKEPLAGVNIIVRGTTKGTTTDAKGQFSIDAEDDDILVFSFIGYSSAEIAVSGRSVIDLSMEVDILRLREVTVNAGYWNVKEKESTGNISKVTSEDIQKQPGSNPLLSLQGRIPGIFVQPTNGIAGGAINVRIRGRNSIRSNGNNPLFVIDGVPFPSTSLASSLITSATSGGNPLSNINPADIESIEVLKDADATAIYGSRGANGVILITTKKGREGRTSVDVNINTGVGKVTNKLELLNTQQYLEMRNEAFKNDNASPQEYDYDVNGAWDNSRYTDWQKELIGGSAKFTNAQFSVSGSEKNTQFHFNGGFYRETPVYPGSFSYRKNSALLSLGHTSADKRLTFSASASFSAENNNLPNVIPTVMALKLPPNAPSVYDENGNLNWQNGTWDNPIAALLKEYKILTKNLISNITIGYEVLPNLVLKARMGYTNMSLEENVKSPLKSFSPAWGLKSTSSFFANSSINTTILEPQAEYKVRWSSNDVTIHFGSTFQETLQNGQTLQGSGYTSDALLENIQAATSISIMASDYTQYKYNAIFGRINYNYNGKYIVNLTGRRDGSSRFGPGKRFGNFGAIGAAWIFSNEGFLSNISLLSFGKLRASYGITGSDQIPDYGFLDTYSPTSYTYAGGSGLVPTRLVNQDYSWETNTKLEVAMDLGIVKDKINLSTSWYKNRSSNQLVGFPLPAITGQSSIQYNLPATVENTGWEFDLNTVNLTSDHFKWQSSLNFTFPKNKLVDYPNISGSPYANTFVVGEPLSIVKTFSSRGINPDTGVFEFNDVDGDGSISSPNDRQTIKFVGQKFYGGLHNSINYRGFQLDILLQFVKQTAANYYGASGVFYVPGFFGNQPVEVMNRWQQPGDVASFQRFTQSYSDPAITAFDYSQNRGDNSVEDSSFIRLKNVSLSWSLPYHMKRQLRLVEAKIYLLGQNLLTVTNYTGLDPETLDYTTLPQLKRLTVGMQLTF